MSEGENLRRFDIPATFACLGSLFFWSLGPNFIEYLTRYIDLWTQNLLRYSVACLFWLPFLALNLKRKRIEARVWRRALLPAVANVAFQSLWAAAFYYIDPAFMVLLTKSSVIWIAGFSLIFFADERWLARSRHFWLGLVFSVVGVIGVTCFKEDFGTGRTVAGVIIALLTSMMWAAYTLSVKIALRDVDSRASFSVISIYTVMGLFVLGMKFGRLSDCLTMPVIPWVCGDLGCAMYCSVSRSILHGHSAHRGDGPCSGYPGAARYRPGNFPRCFWRVVESASSAFRPGLAGRRRLCHFGPTARKPSPVTRASWPVTDDSYFVKREAHLSSYCHSCVFYFGVLFSLLSTRYSLRSLRGR